MYTPVYDPAEHTDNKDVSNDDLYAILAGDLLPSEIHQRRAEEYSRKANNKLIGARQNEVEQELASFSTRNLLKRLRHSYRDGGVQVEVQEMPDGAFAEQFYEDGRKSSRDVYVTHIATLYALKKVLATRPHVPNKIEGHTKRKAAATAHHGKKKPGGRRIKHAGTGTIEVVHHR